jgi:hypothetical protein
VAISQIAKQATRYVASHAVLDQAVARPQRYDRQLDLHGGQSAEHIDTKADGGSYTDESYNFPGCIGDANEASRFVDGFSDSTDPRPHSGHMRKHDSLCDDGLFMIVSRAWLSCPATAAISGPGRAPRRLPSARREDLARPTSSANLGMLLRSRNLALISANKPADKAATKYPWPAAARDETSGRRLDRAI